MLRGRQTRAAVILLLPLLVGSATSCESTSGKHDLISSRPTESQATATRSSVCTSENAQRPRMDANDACQRALAFAKERDLIDYWATYTATDDGGTERDHRFFLFCMGRDSTAHGFDVGLNGRCSMFLDSLLFAEVKCEWMDRVRAATPPMDTEVVGSTEAAELVGAAVGVARGCSASPSSTQVAPAADGGWLVLVWPGIFYETFADGTIQGCTTRAPFVVHVDPAGRCCIVPP